MPEFEPSSTVAEAGAYLEYAANRNVPRRRVLRGIGLLGAVAAYEAVVTAKYDNMLGGNILHPDPEVITVANPYNYLFIENDTGYDPTQHNGVQTDVTTLMIPGLNCDYEDEMATALTKTYGQYSRMTRLHLGNKGVNVEDVSELADVVASDLQRHGARDIRNKKLFIHGHSMGGLLACRIGAALSERHHITPALITLDCSPAHIADSKENKAGNMLTVVRAIKTTLGYQGGPWGRGGLEAVNELWNEHGTIQSAIVLAERSTEPDKPSPQLVISEIEALDLSLSGGEIAALRNARVPIRYLMPDNEQNDRTVATRQAITAYAQYFPGQVTAMTIHGGGHANPNDCPDGYNPVLLSMLHHLRFERYNQAHRRQYFGGFYPSDPPNILR